MGMKKFLLGLVGIVCALFAVPSWGACNLFNMDWLLNAPNWTKNGDVYSGPADSMWSTYASGGQHFPMTFATNTQYTFSGHVGANPAIARFSIVYTDGTSYMLSFGVDGDFSYTSSAGKTISRVNFGNSASGNIQLSNIQVEEGTTATPYTPYDATCIERCKNLFDGELAIGGLLFANGAVTNETQYLYSIRSIPVIPNTSYVLSADTSKIKKGEVYFYKNNGEYNGHISDALKNLPIAFTTPEDTYQVKFILMGSGENLQPSDATNVQLEQGSTATAYVPYVAACHKIQVASTKYVETEFSALNTALANAVATVNTVVTQTIAQAASIATLQSGKQTRPADNTECPAYKQCLLVEDENGTPHWYEITDPFRDFFTPIIANQTNGNTTAQQAAILGYTQLEYIESTGTQYIDTRFVPTSDYKHTLVFSTTDDGTGYIAGTAADGGRGGNVKLSGGKLENVYVGSAGAVATALVNNPYSYMVTSKTTLVMDLHNNAVSNVFLSGQNISSGNVATIVSTNSLYLFGSGEASPLRSRIYQDIIEQNGVLVRNFVPVIDNTTGKVGMYDTVGGRFYGNAASSGDDFTPGPIVENDADVPVPTWYVDWNANSAINLSAGTAIGTAVCNSSPAGATPITDSGWNTVGAYCWCKLTGINVGGEYTAAPDVAPWKKIYTFDGATNCVTGCNGYCAYHFRNQNSTRISLTEF